MADKTVTAVMKDDGTIELTAAPGAEPFAYRIADLLKKGSGATKAAKMAKSATPDFNGSPRKAHWEKWNELESQAAKWERLVDQNYYLDRDLKDFYKEKAAECRGEAARLRGEPVEPAPAGQPLS